MSRNSAPASAPPSGGRPVVNAALFLATVLSVFFAGKQIVLGAGIVSEDAVTLWDGWRFAIPFLAILTFHEFGHWILARIHGVPASLPYFIPLPLLSWFGTLGAVIAMPDRIRSRNALLDIGMAGPIAGMLVAIPAMVIGLWLSPVEPLSPDGYIQEGQSLLYWLIKRLVLGQIAPGYDVQLHPTAFAAWGGFLITMVNLLPWGQLDGGHVAYALFGEKQHRIARWVRASLPLLFLYNVAQFAWPLVRDGRALSYGDIFTNSEFWLVWFVVLSVIGRVSGSEHPPCEPGELTRGRKWAAVGTLALFVALFMPTPFAMY